MKELDEQILKTLHDLPTNPLFSFSWAALMRVIFNIDLPSLDFYKMSSDLALRGSILRYIHCLIACMILDDILLPKYSADYKKHIIDVLGNTHKDEIKECVGEYIKLRAVEINNAYQDFKEKVLKENTHVLSCYCDPEKAKEFIEKCKAERLTN